MDCDKTLREIGGAVNSLRMQLAKKNDEVNHLREKIKSLTTKIEERERMERKWLQSIS